jgi:dipeptidyl aminopeptidase/acylaminoacyl peptidase
MHRPRFLSKRLVRLSLLLFTLYLVLCACAAKFLVDITLHQSHGAFTRLAPPSWLAKASFGGQPQEVSVQAEDGVTLRAWYFVHSAVTRNAVLILHGLGDTRRGMSGQAELFLRHGYNVLIPDSRAHGASGGELATFGVLEADDVHRWVSWLKERLPDGGCVFGSGVSMGAGIILQAAEREPRFCGVIAEAPYASFREIAYDRMGQPFHLGPWFGETIARPIIEFGMIYARSKYNVNLEEASPMAALHSTAVPVLLIAGLDDDNIPIRHSRMIHERNPQVMLWEVAGVGHGSAISDARADYEKHVMRFVNSARKQNAAAASSAAQ